MIVRADESSLLLITQPDHAALAARLMTHWVAGGLPQAPRRSSILHAIREHDNGWQEIDLRPLVSEAGQILDFVSAPIEVRQGIWPRGVGRLTTDPFAAALVAEHAIQIYSRFQSDAAWAGFFSTMAQLRDTHARTAGVTVTTVAEDYFFLRMADLISLAFCNGWAERQELGAYSFTLEGDVMVIAPDPFGGVAVRLEVPARRVPRTARWAASIEAAWRSSALETLRGEIRAQAVR